MDGEKGGGGMQVGEEGTSADEVMLNVLRCRLTY